MLSSGAFSGIQNIQQNISKIKNRMQTISDLYGPKSSETFESVLTNKISPEPQAQIQQFIDQASKTHNVDKKLITEVIRAESNFKIDALSPKGAQGLMQLMPSTAKSLGVKNPLNARENIFGGTKYLREMLNKFDGDIALSLAAYNAGPNAVIRHGNTIPPYKETQNYVQKILNKLDS